MPNRGASSVVAPITPIARLPAASEALCALMCRSPATTPGTAARRRAAAAAAGVSVECARMKAPAASSYLPPELPHQAGPQPPPPHAALLPSHSHCWRPLRAVPAACKLHGPGWKGKEYSQTNPPAPLMAAWNSSSFRSPCTLKVSPAGREEEGGERGWATLSNTFPARASAQFGFFCPSHSSSHSSRSLALTSSVFHGSKTCASHKDKQIPPSDAHTPTPTHQPPTPPHKDIQ